MAITLTKSYQRISTISLTYGEIRTYAKYSSQDMTNNRTTYQIKSTYYTWQAGGVSFSSATATLDGTTKSYGYTTVYGETTLQELSRTLNHNSDGSSPTKNISTSWSATFGGGGSTSGSIVAPKINRYAVTNKVNGDDIEGNFSVDYSTYMSGYTYKLRISVPNVVELEKIDYNTSGESFTLSQETIDALFTRFSNTNTFNLGFAVETWNSAGTSRVDRGNEKIITARITNANPTMTYTCTETNSKAITVLGGNNTNYLIQNVSTPSVIVTPTALKGATVSRVDLTNGAYTNSKTTSPYSFSFIATNGTIGLKVVDSRNNSVEETITKTLIEYEPVTINSFNFERQNPTSSNLILNADIKYYQKTFNETQNVPTVEWMVASGDIGLFPSDDLFPSDETYIEVEWNTIDPSDYTIDTQNNKIIISNLLLTNVIDYRQKGELYLKVNDLLSIYNNHMTVIKGIPTMDIGEHDVCINGELYIADEDRENKKSVSKYLEKNIITLRLSQNTTVNSDAKIPFDESVVVGDRLTVNSSSVVVGEGVKSVLINANMLVQYNSSTGDYGCKVHINGIEISWLRAIIRKTDGSNMTNSASISPVLYEVEEGDTIELRKVGANGTIRPETWLTVQAIEIE